MTDATQAESQITEDEDSSVAEKPSIFISYSHLDEDRRRLIVSELSRITDIVNDADNGWQMLYDWDEELGIQKCEDWRTKLVDMLEKSGGRVLAIISANSMKEKGVCRDELAIAANKLHGQILPVLITPEDDVINIPPMVTHRQWINLSDWDNLTYQDGDTLAFTQDAKNELVQLKEALANPNLYSFSEEINRLNNKLNPSQNISKWNKLLGNEQYYDRTWLTEYVDTWAKSRETSRMLVLVANPGFGKSSWAAHFAHHWIPDEYRVALGALVERKSDRHTDLKVITKTVAFSLACLMKQYREELTKIIENNPQSLSTENTHDLFDTLISVPLSDYIDGGHENVVVIIDGIDEATQTEEEPNPLAELLAKKIEDLPEWIKVIVTTRNVPAVIEELESACAGNGDDEDELCTFFWLSEDERRFDDIKTFAEEQLKDKYGEDECFEEAIKKLIEKSQGDFQAIALIVDILNKPSSGDLLETIDEMPKGLKNIIESWFKFIFGEDKGSIDPETIKALGYILLAPDELPIEDLSFLTGWNEGDTNAFLEKIQIISRGDTNVFGQETISLSHDYIKSWLRNIKSSRKPFYIDKLEIQKTMAEKYADIARSGIDNLSAYQKVYILDIFRQANLTEEYNELRSNQEFIEKFTYCLDKSPETKGKLTDHLKRDTYIVAQYEKLIAHLDDWDYVKTMGDDSKKFKWAAITSKLMKELSDDYEFRHEYGKSCKVYKKYYEWRKHKVEIDNSFDNLEEFVHAFRLSHRCLSKEELLNVKVPIYKDIDKYLRSLQLEYDNPLAIDILIYLNACHAADNRNYADSIEIVQLEKNSRENFDRVKEKFTTSPEVFEQLPANLQRRLKKGNYHIPIPEAYQEKEEKRNQTKEEEISEEFVHKIINSFRSEEAIQKANKSLIEAKATLKEEKLDEDFLQSCLLLIQTLEPLLDKAQEKGIQADTLHDVSCALFKLGNQLEEYENSQKLTMDVNFYFLHYLKNYIKLQIKYLPYSQKMLTQIDSLSSKAIEVCNGKNKLSYGWANDSDIFIKIGGVYCCALNWEKAYQFFDRALQQAERKWISHPNMIMQIPTYEIAFFAIGLFLRSGSSEEVVCALNKNRSNKRAQYEILEAQKEENTDILSGFFAKTSSALQYFQNSRNMDEDLGNMQWLLHTSEDVVMKCYEAIVIVAKWLRLNPNEITGKVEEV